MFLIHTVTQNMVKKTLFWTSVKFRIAIAFTIFLLHLKSFFFDLLHTKLNRNPQNIISKVQYKIITWLFNNLDLDYSMQNNMSEKNKTTIQYNFLLSWTPPPSSNYHLNVMYHTIFVFVQLYCRCILSDLPTTQIINKTNTELSIF